MKSVLGGMALIAAIVMGIAVPASAPAMAQDFEVSSGDPFPGAGDEDPFPLMCTDFSGSWKGDSGGKYVISQRRCGWIRVQMFWGTQQDSMTIVPDNRTRPGPSRDSQVRHRWNSPKNATVIESHRSFSADGARVVEVTMMERAPGTDLLLETTYRTIYCGDAEPQREYEQQVFRRQGNPAFDDLTKPKRKAGR